MQNIRVIINGIEVTCEVLGTQVFNPKFLIHRIQLPNGEIRYCPIFGANPEVGRLGKPPPKS